MAPTDFTHIDRAPGVSAVQKLREIDQAPIRVQRILNCFKLTLPYIEGLTYAPTRPSLAAAYDNLHVERINIGDEALYGKGIGTRLVRAAVRHCLEAYSTVETLTATWVRLGAVNTFVRALGTDAVKVTQYGQTYGAGTGRQLEDMFDAHPFQAEEPYYVGYLEATLVPEKSAAWELPILI